MFSTLMVSVLLPPTFFLDASIRATLRDFQFPVLLGLMQALTWIGEDWVLIVAALALYGIGRRRKRQRLKQAGALGLIALAASAGVVQVIKHLAGRPRPDLVDRGILNWGPSFERGHDAFPSGHATLAFALAAVLSSVYPSGRWIWYSLAVLVAFTRIYIDVHFASDVFVGAVLGLLIGIWASMLKLERLKP
ncbi:MAG: phosphatase PAP2 family protein [Nitrospirota bacterium]